MTEKHEFRPALTEWKGYCYCSESGFSRPGLDGISQLKCSSSGTEGRQFQIRSASKKLD